MAHYFGEIKNGAMILNDIGRFVESQLRRVIDILPYIEIPTFVVMPNHLHAIICVGNGGEAAPDSPGDLRNERNPNPLLRDSREAKRHIPAVTRYISSLKGP